MTLQKRTVSFTALRSSINEENRFGQFCQGNFVRTGPMSSRYT